MSSAIVSCITLLYALCFILIIKLVKEGDGGFGEGGVKDGGIGEEEI